MKSNEMKKKKKEKEIILKFLKEDLYCKSEKTGPKKSKKKKKHAAVHE